MTVLDDILEGVRADVAARMQQVPLDDLKARTAARRALRATVWRRCAATT